MVSKVDVTYLASYYIGVNVLFVKEYSEFTQHLTVFRGLNGDICILHEVSYRINTCKNLFEKQCIMLPWITNYKRNP